VNRLAILAVLATPCLAQAAPALTPAQTGQIDAAANQTLALTGVPGASLAVVKDGKIAYLNAYGLARLNPPEKVTTGMAFPIGSVSKQFTAALVLLLQQDGKLSLDDKVGKFLPELTQANNVTIRQILSHTAGYQDFWPEDYSPLAFAHATTPQAVVDQWAKKKLDFPPGTAWQYSNTGYAIAALIVEKAGGAPFFEQAQKRIFQPLGMKDVGDYDAHGVPKGGPVGYERYAFAQPRPAPLDKPGWSFGSGGLAMPAADLAIWDISVMNRSLLALASYDAMETEIKLQNGQGTGYGLGVELGSTGSHRYIEHSGEETGFVTENIVYPDDKAAIVVLTNQDASRAASVIARQIAPVAFGIPAMAPKDRRVADVLAMLDDLAHGKVDAARLNANAQSYFSPPSVADYHSSLAKLGPPLGARERTHEDRGGMVFHVYEVTYPGRTVTVTTYEEPDGTLDQFLIVP
jgi:CubicO group peptidase (beta-lactamase class C family)